MDQETLKYFQSKSTEELTELLEKHNTQIYKEEVFVIMQHVLDGRGNEFNRYMPGYVDDLAKVKNESSSSEVDQEFDENLELSPPPVQLGDNNSDNKSTSKSVPIKQNDKPLLKNLPFMIIAPTLLTLFRIPQHQPQSFAFILGYFLGYLAMLTGLPILIVRIAKWLSKNKNWDEKATKTVWIIHAIIVILPLIGTLRTLLYR